MFFGGGGAQQWKEFDIRHKHRLPILVNDKEGRNTHWKNKASYGAGQTECLHVEECK